jgi:hypothetical protein
VQPAPQGLVAVKSAPSGAGRPGRGESHDWDEIIPWIEADPWQEYKLLDPVPFNAVARWRQRFPKVRFRTVDRHYREVESRVGGDKRLVKQLWCGLYVTWTGEDNADQVSDTEA